MPYFEFDIFMLCGSINFPCHLFLSLSLHPTPPLFIKKVNKNVLHVLFVVSISQRIVTKLIYAFTVQNNC